MNMRYGVQFEPETTSISAGVVRKQGDREVFITKCDVTQQVIGSAAWWLLIHHGNAPCRFVDRNGLTYELTARIVP